MPPPASKSLKIIQQSKQSQIQKRKQNVIMQNFTHLKILQTFLDMFAKSYLSKPRLGSVGPSLVVVLWPNAFNSFSYFAFCFSFFCSRRVGFFGPSKMLTKMKMSSTINLKYQKFAVRPPLLRFPSALFSKIEINNKKSIP